MAGRFAPSPTGDLHLGNLRTALVAWTSARQRGLGFVVRMEDLDRTTSSPEHERRQLDDLATIGIDWDGPVERQSDRFDHYHDAIARLAEAGLVYECYCTRREVRAEIERAPQAPHRPPGAYPGTCRDLTDAARRRRRDDGRAPALRLRAPRGAAAAVEVDDAIGGRHAGAVDDVVLRRNDGVPAYNLAVVVDDAAQGVTQVVRADDLLSSTPRQVHLQRLLGLPTPDYAHVPLVVGADGERLAKRHGAVTLRDLSDAGVATEAVVAWLLDSVAAAVDGADDGPTTPADLVGTLRLDELAGPPVVLDTSIAFPIDR